MAQAVPIPTRSTFIAQLLAPIAPPTDLRALRELRRELEDAWLLVHHRYWAAHAFNTYCRHTTRAAEVERKTLKVPEAEAEGHAHLKLTGAINALMLVPAPTIGALRQKQKLRDFSGGRDRWDAAIAADIARLQPARAELGDARPKR